jgi:transketolase
MTMGNARKAFTSTIFEFARLNKDIVVIASDSRGSVTLGDFFNQLPEQSIECGIAEQDAVGIAAGLANAGLKPYVCGPAAFYSSRAVEQIKIDVAYSNSNVKIIGVSGGVSYGALGGTHHSVQDIAIMRTFAGLNVILPADFRETVEMTKRLIDTQTPTYVRVGRGDVPDVYVDGCDFEIGRANILLRGQAKVAIIACGEMVYPALQAGKMLDASVIDMHTINPLDIGAIDMAAECGAIVTVEEHCVNGGLGGTVAEVVSQRHLVPMRILGLPNERLYSGTSKEVFEKYNLTVSGISQAAREIMK